MTTERILAHLERIFQCQSGSARMRSVSPMSDVRSYHDQSSDDDVAHSGDPESACELVNFAPSCSIVTRLSDSISRRSRKTLRLGIALPLRRRAWNFEARTSKPSASRLDAAASADRRGRDDRRGPRGSCADQLESDLYGQIRRP